MMVTRTTQNHVKETPKQPYQSIVSIGCLACALMQQITMKYAKKRLLWQNHGILHYKLTIFKDTPIVTINPNCIPCAPGHHPHLKKTGA